MDNKKKYRFGFVILLGLLFTLLFSIYSECYALTPSNQMTAYGMEQLFNKLNDENNIYTSSITQNSKDALTSFINSADWGAVATTWNSIVSTTTFPYLENMQIIWFYNSSYTNRFYFVILPNNNGIGDTLYHLGIWGAGTTGDYDRSLSCLDDNLSSKNSSYQLIHVNNNNLVNDGIKTFYSSWYLTWYNNNSGAILSDDNATCYIPGSIRF